MDHLPKLRVFRHIAIVVTLLTWTVSGAAAEPITAVAPAHGPVLMLYVSQPLGGSATNRVYGLRLSQTSQQPTLQATMSSGLYASSPTRSLVDLQVRREADIRVEFGQRFTWDVRRRELNLSSSSPPKSMTFVVHAP